MFPFDDVIMSIDLPNQHSTLVSCDTSPFNLQNKLTDSERQWLSYAYPFTQYMIEILNVFIRTSLIYDCIIGDQNR